MNFLCKMWTGIIQAVQWLAMGWTTRVWLLAVAGTFSSPPRPDPMCFPQIVYTVDTESREWVCELYLHSFYVIIAWWLIKVKDKVVPVLFLTEHHAMKAYWEWRYSSTHSLTSTVDGGEWSASCPGRFTLIPRYPLDRRLGGPQSCSGRGGEEKNSQPPPGIEP
jgi:hypothetical protein